MSNIKVIFQKLPASEQEFQEKLKVLSKESVLFSNLENHKLICYFSNILSVLNPLGMSYNAY